MHRRLPLSLVVPLLCLGTATTAVSPANATASASARSHPRVLRVGSYHGIAGQYRTIEAAVRAAHRGDIVLIGPGDYKTRSSRAPRGGPPAGVLITTPGITLRGMNRNRTIVDGTKSGPACSTARKDQNFGPNKHGHRLGLNGIMPWKADNVSVENLTACNFLDGYGGDTGNQIWWNGGDESGKIGGWGFYGSHLTTTSTYFRNERTAAQYGVFSSNWNGGHWTQQYASNFNDSGFYIGACQRQCNQYVDHIWAEFNALGYSGSNSGGRLVVRNSEFDHNEDGFDTNSQNGDNPPPQNGACPHNGISPITHTHSCWVFMHNYVHDNNNPNVPGAGIAAAGPVGTGISISGGRNDTIMDNRFVRNKAWGTILVPFPDSGPPCTGGTGGTSAGATCLYDEWGIAVLHNRYAHNGGFGNPTNGDIAAANLEPHPTDCYRGNRKTNGKPATTSPSDLQSTYPKCNGQTVPPNGNPTFVSQALCDSQVEGSTASACPPGSHYPRRKRVIMHPLPGAHRDHGVPATENPQSAHLRTMRHPCASVPANPWCPRSHGGKPGPAPYRAQLVPLARVALPPAIRPDGSPVTGA